MIEYYITAYDNLEFRKLFGKGLEDAIMIQVKMNQFERCWISFKIFDSTLSLRHVKSSYILAKFITSDGFIDCYPEQVQYYFVHIVDFSDSYYEYFLAYVHWYQSAGSLNIRYHFRNDKTCNVELWNTEFYPEGHNCIILVYHILGRFVPVNYQILTW